MRDNVVVCEHAGFCFGAARAVDSLENALYENIPIYTYGPILNNDKLVENYAGKGVRVVEDIDEFKNLPKGKIIIRSHGVAKAVYEGLLATGNEVFDATCPFVKRIHRIVSERSALGERIVVIGNPVHPEVIGIVGWSQTPATVIETEEQVRAFKPNSGDEKICIVSQTTFNRKKFQEFLDIFNENSYNINVMNTICDATRVRQSEAEELSSQSAVMLVIGDPKSSNSKKLYEICSKGCANTYFIQTVEDLRGVNLPQDGLIGITAGASTPRYIIEEVQNYVRYDF